jgi:hypothetical protein
MGISVVPMIYHVSAWLGHYVIGNSVHLSAMTVVP